MQPVTASNTAAAAHDELMAVLATVDQLVVRSMRTTAAAQELQLKLPALVARIEQIEAAQPPADAQEESQVTWVPGVPKTPAHVTAEHAAAPSGSRSWYVVYVGREPGLYTTVEEADFQIKGVPGQQYRRCANKAEALALYTAKHIAGEVDKLVEVIED
ncbi:hypothetical protein B0H14DRAFT_3425775 [Mycena olivaceomarginata]|nr:hypothetical protein B0H14DRAFT_3425775 [Mycena olivaceomarginata]